MVNAPVHLAEQGEHRLFSPPMAFRSRALLQATATLGLAGLASAIAWLGIQINAVAAIEAELQLAQPRAAAVWRATSGCRDVTLPESGQACASVLALRQALRSMPTFATPRRHSRAPRLQRQPIPKPKLRHSWSTGRPSD